MKTWKKIEDTRKRTNEIVSLKNRNEDRIRMVNFFGCCQLKICVERERSCGEDGGGPLPVEPKLHDLEAASRRKAKSAEGHLPVQD